MRTLLAYDAALETYRLSESHPLRPERFALAVALMDAWGLLRPPDTAIFAARAASHDDLLLAHDADYIEAVQAASEGGVAQPAYGIGPGDTPAFIGMHDAAALAVGATCAAVDAVASGAMPRAYSPAGGLHHAQRDRASGFCIYNDAVVAIERACRDHPGLRVAYIDIDAHHGDGVEAAFWQRADVLTFSVHESGRYLFPGTGRATDVGAGPGLGAVGDVPLPPYAGDDCYRLVLDEVIGPALRAYAPDLIVVQAGGDTHRTDPLTHLDLTVAGYAGIVTGIIAVADEITEGRIVALGGGGYQPFSEVPRMWAAVMALLLGREVPRDLPASWRALARESAIDAGFSPPHAEATFVESGLPPVATAQAEALAGTRFAIDAVRAASPLLGA
jgi:acetoin utilization protein AcuC